MRPIRRSAEDASDAAARIISAGVTIADMTLSAPEAAALPFMFCPAALTDSV